VGSWGEKSSQKSECPGEVRKSAKKSVIWGKLGDGLSGLGGTTKKGRTVRTIKKKRSATLEGED